MKRRALFVGVDEYKDGNEAARRRWRAMAPWMAGAVALAAVGWGSWVFFGWLKNLWVEGLLWLKGLVAVLGAWGVECAGFISRSYPWAGSVLERCPLEQGYGAAYVSGGGMWAEAW